MCADAHADLRVFTGFAHRRFAPHQGYRGFFAYHAVPTNFAALSKFRHRIAWLCTQFSSQSTKRC